MELIKNEKVVSVIKQQCLLTPLKLTTRTELRITSCSPTYHRCSSHYYILSCDKGTTQPHMHLVDAHSSSKCKLFKLSLLKNCIIVSGM